MAISSTYARNPNRDRIIRNSLHTCGVLHSSHAPDANQIALGAEYFQDGLTALQAEGVILQTAERYTQALTDGEEEYAAPADTESIEQGAIIRDTAGADQPIELVSQRMYQGLSEKTVPGQPYWYYPERSATGWRLFLYPVPDSNWAYVIYPRVRKLRDLDVGTANLDLPAKWALPFEMYLSWRFACHYKLPLERAQYFQGIWTGMRNTLMDDETPRGPSRFVMETLFQR